jgi:hypothetical protein
MRLFLILVFVLAQFSGFAQGWESIGEFNRPPYKLWYDSTVNQLYVAGAYAMFDSSEVHGFGYVQGDSVIALGCGFGFHGNNACNTIMGWNGGTDVATGFARFQGDLYVTGTMDYAGGQLVKGIAKWSGNDWVAIGDGLNGHGRGLKVYDGELYVFGTFTTINGIAANGLAKFDGQTWSTVFDLPIFGQGINDPNQISDIEWYNGELYVVGNFSRSGTWPPIRDIAKWNGAEWVAVGPGMTGSFGYLECLAVFDGKLYIGGNFNENINPGGIPGNNITIWNGNSWETMDGGLRGEYNLSASVMDLLEYENELYVIGYFSYAGGLKINNVAKWDGQNWCGTDDVFHLYPQSGAFFQDTLFLAGQFKHINNDSSLKYFAKMDAGYFLDNCNATDRANSHEAELEVSVFPNPGRNALQVVVPKDLVDCKLSIVNINGETVIDITKWNSQSNSELLIDHLPAGLYILRIESRDRVGMHKFMKAK